MGSRAAVVRGISANGLGVGGAPATVLWAEGEGQSAERGTKHPAAAGRTFWASDGYDLSTSQLIALMAKGMNRPERLMPVSMLLQAFGSLLGKYDEIGRLVGSLKVNISYTQTRLGWIPLVSVENGVGEIPHWYAGLLDTQA